MLPPSPANRAGLMRDKKEIEMKIEIRSKFHNSRVVVNVQLNESLTKSQVNRINRTLCGIKDCGCGGINFSQVEDPSGFRLAHQDTRTGETDYFVVRDEG